MKTKFELQLKFSLHSKTTFGRMFILVINIDVYPSLRTGVKLVFYTANYTAIVYSLHKFFLYTEKCLRILQVFQTNFLQKFSADNFRTNFQQTKIRLKTSIQNQFEHIPVFHFTFMGFNICSLGNNNVTNSFA